MKLYNVFGGIAFMCLIIGMASICGAIEWGTSLWWPIVILLVGCVFMYFYVKEIGERYEDL